MRAASHLDNQWRTARKLNDIFKIRGITRKNCLWNTNPRPCHNLIGAQFVARSIDCDRTRRRERSLIFKLTQNCRTVFCDALGNSRYHCIIMIQCLSFVTNNWVVFFDRHIALAIGNNIDVMPSLPSLFKETLCRVVGWFIGQNSNFHKFRSSSSSGNPLPIRTSTVYSPSRKKRRPISTGYRSLLRSASVNRQRRVSPLMVIRGKMT